MPIVKKDYIFVEKFKVRDYECDLQGIVNNANYQHYTEHAWTWVSYLHSFFSAYSLLGKMSIIGRMVFCLLYR